MIAVHRYDNLMVSYGREGSSRFVYLTCGQAFIPPSTVRVPPALDRSNNGCGGQTISDCGPIPREPPETHAALLAKPDMVRLLSICERVVRYLADTPNPIACHLKN